MDFHKNIMLVHFLLCTVILSAKATDFNQLRRNMFDEDMHKAVPQAPEPKAPEPQAPVPKAPEPHAAVLAADQSEKKKPKKTVKPKEKKVPQTSTVTKFTVSNRYFEYLGFKVEVEIPSSAVNKYGIHFDFSKSDLEVNMQKEETFDSKGDKLFSAELSESLEDDNANFWGIGMRTHRKVNVKPIILPKTGSKPIHTLLYRDGKFGIKSLRHGEKDSSEYSDSSTSDKSTSDESNQPFISIRMQDKSASGDDHVGLITIGKPNPEDCEDDWVFVPNTGKDNLQFEIESARVETENERKISDKDGRYRGTPDPAIINPFFWGIEAEDWFASFARDNIGLKGLRKNSVFQPWIHPMNQRTIDCENDLVKLKNLTLRLQAKDRKGKWQYLEIQPKNYMHTVDNRHGKHDCYFNMNPQDFTMFMWKPFWPLPKDFFGILGGPFIYDRCIQIDLDKNRIGFATKKRRSSKESAGSGSGNQSAKELSGSTNESDGSDERVDSEE
ncbi:hypothetical protein Ddc_16302 [Ditylenchus destructor]|nr:hypothetical protein Ddc_16302 [Ditylenchus destructor]